MTHGNENRNHNFSYTISDLSILKFAAGVVWYIWGPVLGLKQISLTGLDIFALN